MPMWIHMAMEIKGSEALLRRLTGVHRKLKGDRLTEPWQRAVELVADSARGFAPRWQGDLAAGIEEEILVEGEDILGVIYDDEFYAPFQEFGTREYWPNIDAITDWADDHGVSPYVVARSIHNRGVPEIKFFERALEENVEAIGDLIGDAVAVILMEEY